MKDVYEQCPEFENEHYRIRLLESTDWEDLLKVYSDKKAVPFFNSDGCFGDFYVTDPENMRFMLEAWQEEYRKRGFVRWTVIDKRSGEAVGTIELFQRIADDYFTGCGLLRLDLRSDYERAAEVQSILSLIVPSAYEMFGCEKIATKAIPEASERRKALRNMNFVESEEQLIGHDGTKYNHYFVKERKTELLSSCPILEYDDNKEAKLNPSNFVESRLETDKLIITFFPEVMQQLVEEGQISLERTIEGENSILLYRFTDTNILITLGYIGCPACAGNLDLFHAMGINKVMFCGGGGVLDKNIEVGQILVVDGAIRDEGFSYHYLPPSRYVYTNPEVTAKIVNYLDRNEISYIRGLTWTTDAIFRETKDKIIQRKAEGAKIVEMEQAGCIAVSRFRNFAYGALIYGGDDLSQDEWSQRGWRSRKGIRYDLVNLCKILVELI